MMNQSVNEWASTDLLKITAYDRLLSFLAAIIAVIALVVGMLAMAWFADGKRRLPQYSIPMQLDSVADRGDLTQSNQDVLVEMTSEEFPEIRLDDRAREIREVSQAISSVAARLGNDIGARERGGPTEHSRTVTPPERVDGTNWSVDYRFSNLVAYSNSLVANRIKLLVVRKQTDEIVVIDLTGRTAPRIARRSEFKNAVYFAPIRPELERWDAILVQRQGVDLTDAFCVHWFDESLVKKLAQLEQSAANPTDRSQPSRTRFELGTGPSNVDWQVQQPVFSRGN